MKKDEEPIIIEQTFNVSIKTVWSAITEIGQMRQWYFKNIPSFKPEVGFRVQFNVQNEERSFLHMWEVTEVMPENKIAYKWKYENYPGDSVVAFELFEQNNLTTLRLTHHVLESFPDDIPEFARESGVGGWTYFISKCLKEFMEKND